MTRASFNTKQWVALGKASRLLEVNEATLRRWADRGLVRSYRTAGGHRRFSLEDIHTFAEGAQVGEDGDRAATLVERALHHIRRRLKGRSVTSQPWYDEIHEEDRVRMRLFGYRLLTLASDFLGGRSRKHRILEEAWLIGEEYGSETARLQVPLEHIIPAFAFFRNALMEGLQESSITSSNSYAVYRTWRQVNTVTDEVLQGIVHGYDRGRAPR